MRFYLVFLLCVLCVAAFAADTLYLIPTPKKVEINKGRFVYYGLNPDSLIDKVIGNTTAEIPPLAVHSKMYINWAIAKDKTLGAEGYRLRVTPTKITITANTHAGLFYGTQTLVQLIKANSFENSIPCVTITDTPDFKIRAWQDDISRGPIPTMDFLKEQVRVMSSYKMNAFMLYMENVVKLKAHPDLAPPDALTIDELKELIAYAKQYHVTVIGNFQSYGHFEKTLRVPGYENLGENAFTLSPAKEEAYKFLSDAYSELLPLFDYEYFHVNCDEVALGNKGPAKQLVDSLGESGVYAYHINRVNDLLKPYHKKMMLWGDMIVKDSIALSRVPKDAMVVSWGYGPTEKRADDLKPLVKAGLDFMVAPGVSCWSRIYPDISRSIINIYHYLHDGYKYGAKGFINTTWDDDGQNLFNNNWYGLLFGAHLGWNVPQYANTDSAIAHREEHVAIFNRAFNRLQFDTTYDVAALMRSVADLNYGPVKNCMSTAAYWQTPLTDKTYYPAGWEQDNNEVFGLTNTLHDAARTLAEELSKNSNYLYLLDLAIYQSRAILNTNVANLYMRKHIYNGTQKQFELNRTLAILKGNYDINLWEYKQFWNWENRPAYLDTVISYYNTHFEKLKEVPAVCILQPSDTLVNGVRPIRLQSAFDNLPVYYTLNGTEPTAHSTLYTQPIAVNSNVRIKARVIDSTKMYEVVEDTLVFHKGIGKLYKLNSEWTATNPAYAAGGRYALLDGRRGSPANFSDGRWQGYLDKDIDIVLDMGAPTAINKVTIGCGQLAAYGIMMPGEFYVTISNDGVNYEDGAAIAIAGFSKEIDYNRLLEDIDINLEGKVARYIKVVIKNYGPLPKGHFAEGKPSWLFVDEIMVE